MNEQKIGLGTAAIGRPEYINIKPKGAVTAYDPFEIEQNAMNIFNAAYKSGVRYFDTAPGYGIGESLLLNWTLANKQNSVEIGTKWGYTYEADLQKGATHHELKNHELRTLNQQYQTSRMFGEQLMFYQIHSAGFDTNVLNDKAVLNELAAIKQQLGTKIGITTSGPQQIEAIEKAVNIEIDGRSLFDSFQVTYNLLHQDLHLTIHELKKLGKAVIVKEAMANGRVFTNSNYSHYAPIYKVMTRLAEKYDVGHDAIALRFVLDTVPADYVLSGASTIDQLNANMKANYFKLTNQELMELKDDLLNMPPYWDERKKLAWQ